jgi:oxalate decarboxylase
MKLTCRVLFSSSLLLLNTAYAEPSAPSQKVSNSVSQFIEQQKNQLSPEFPYRINLFTQGQIIKNKFGTRIAENASQFPSDNFGQFFYYNLLDQGMRVPHWHANAIEVGTVLTGKMRVTIWEGVGDKNVFTVNPENTWVIPQGALHSLENVGKEELTFVLAYNAPITADVQFEQAWAFLPDAILAKSTGITEEEIQQIKKSNVERLSGFDAGAIPESADLNGTYSSNFLTTKPIYQSELGSIKRIDSSNNTKIQQMAFQQTLLKPGTLRLPHWYTAGDTFLYVAKGKGFFTMLDRDGKSFNAMIEPGDLIALPVGTIHGYLNTGEEDLVLYEAFNVAKDIQEISLLDGAQHLNKGALGGAMGLNQSTVDRLMEQKPMSYMTSFE